MEWTNDGFIYYSGLQNRLRRVHESGGTPSFAFPGTPNKVYWPHLLPGENYALVISAKVGQVQTLNLSNGEFRNLGLEAGYAMYARSGHLLYSTSDRSVQAVPFDLATWSVHGTGITVLNNVAVSGNYASAFALSQNGSLLYISGYLRYSKHEPFKIARVGRDGTVGDVVVDEGALQEGFALLRMGIASPFPVTMQSGFIIWNEERG